MAVNHQVEGREPELLRGRQGHEVLVFVQAQGRALLVLHLEQGQEVAVELE